jgi:hypothetical protein
MGEANENQKKDVMEKISKNLETLSSTQKELQNKSVSLSKNIREQRV